MLEKSFGLLFFLKQSKNNTKGDKYVYLRIIVDGIPKELSTKRLWSPNRWNAAIGKANGNKEEDRNLNAFLDSLYHKVLQAKI